MATRESRPNSRVATGRQFYDFFVSTGMPPHQAAAIAGNMAWEGGGRSDLVNPGDNYRNSPGSPHSAGIGQWNDRLPDLVAFARGMGVDIPPGDLRDQRYVQDVIRRIPTEMQLEFSHAELNTSEGRAGRNIQNAPDLRSAAAGAIGYHRPAGWTPNNPEAGHGFNNRLSLASQILNAGGDTRVDTTQPEPVQTQAPPTIPTPPPPSETPPTVNFDGLSDERRLEVIRAALDSQNRQPRNPLEDMQLDGFGQMSARAPSPTDDSVPVPQVPQMRRVDLSKLRASLQNRRLGRV